MNKLWLVVGITFGIVAGMRVAEMAEEARLDRLAFAAGLAGVYIPSDEDEDSGNDKSDNDKIVVMRLPRIA